MKTEIINVSPDYARNLLLANKTNRPIRKHKIKEMSDDMKGGKWRLSHQGIAIDTNGNLADGQHRLKAVVESGETVKMLVTTGCSPENFGITDTGSPRTRADVICLSGVSPLIAKITSSSIPWCAVYEYTGQARSGFASNEKFVNENLNQWCLTWLEKNKGLLNSAQFVAQLPRSGKFLTSSISCFVHYQISKVGGNADQFLTELLVDGSTNSNLVLEMRRQLILNISGTRKLLPAVIAKRVIVTYNRWASGKTFVDPVQIIGRVQSDTDAERLTG